jgi:hypothetical protein
MFITEEAAEIVSNYFYEMGLNSDGISILAEELGAEEFSGFVEDIVQESVIYEARADQGELLTKDLKARKNPKITKSQGTSSPVKDRQPTRFFSAQEKENDSSKKQSASPGQLSLFGGDTKTKSAKPRGSGGGGFAPSAKSKPPARSTRSRSERNVRPEPQPTGTSKSRRKERRSGLTADPWNLPFSPKESPQTPTKRAEPQKLLPPARSAAVKNAVQSQKPGAPKSTSKGVQGVLHNIGKGIERHNRATKQLSAALGSPEARAAREKLGKGLAHAGSQVLQGFFGAAKAHGRVFKEDFESWVEQLIDEGYDLSEYTWDDMLGFYEENLEESHRARMNESEDYSKIISHLISEGYVSTIENAHIMIQNMSDSWMADILS